MKILFFAIAIVFLSVCAAVSGMQCYLNPVRLPDEWVTIQSSCRLNMQRQIQLKVNTSTQYLAMAAFFSRDTVNRPGFAKLFFDKATDERNQAMKLIDYLLLRGELTEDISNLFKLKSSYRTSWNSGVEALEDALKMESAGTVNIRNVIKSCEDDHEFNDYHLGDYLSGGTLEKQYNVQRDFAGMTSTLKKMFDRHSALGEFIFDKKLLDLDLDITVKSLPLKSPCKKFSG